MKGKNNGGSLMELNEHSNEYRWPLDYITYILDKFNIKNVVINESNPYFVLGFVRRFYHTRINTYCSAGNARKEVSRILGKRLRAPIKTDCVVYPFSLEDEDDWEKALSNTIDGMGEGMIVIAFRSSISYRRFFKRRRRCLSPGKVRAFLESKGFRIVDERGALNPKYLFYSLVALIFERLGKSELYFMYQDKADKEYFTGSPTYVAFSYIRIIVARRS